MSDEDTAILSTKKLVLQSIRESDRALTEKVFEVLQQRADEMAKLEAEVVQLEEALQSIDRQVPNAPGGEFYVISPGALYKVRAALYGSGGPRPKEETALSSEAPKSDAYRIELLELIAKQAETYLLVSTPRETRLEGPAMSERELKTSLQELKDLESSEAPENEDAGE